MRSLMLVLSSSWSVAMRLPAPSPSEGPAARPEDAGTGPGSGSPRTAARSFQSARRLIRETCICETPSRRPISCWVSSSSKRIRRTCHSSSLSSAASDARSASTRSKPASVSPIASSPVAASSSSVRRGASSDRVRRAWPASSASSTSSTEIESRAGDLVGGRKAPELLGQAAGGVVDLHRDLLETAREAHVPDVVAEVTPDLAEDRRHGERREPTTVARVEPVNGLHEAESGHLDQVVERLGLAPVAHRERPRQRHETPHELLPGVG